MGYVGYWASVIVGTLPAINAYRRFAPSLGHDFDLGFLQIRHWLSTVDFPR